MIGMEINRQTLKALASESRLEILKALAERRKMPAELARQLGLSGSTIVEHLNLLERAGLIKRLETGHKWIYYELTDKGASLAKPRFPVQFIIMLSLGVIFIFGSFARYIISSMSGSSMAAGKAMTTAGAPAENVGAAASIVTVDWILILLLLAGLVLLVAGLIGLLRGRLAWLK